MRYRLLDIATADIAFEAYGKDLNELFVNIGKAVTEIMTDIKKVKPEMTKEFEVHSEDLESLVFDFISELLYYKDAEGLVFSDFEIRIEKNEKYNLKCIAKGEKLKREKHEIRMEVKAATYHQMLIKRDKEWKARIVLDV